MDVTAFTYIGVIAVAYLIVYPILEKLEGWK